MVLDDIQTQLCKPLHGHFRHLHEDCPEASSTTRVNAAPSAPSSRKLAKSTTMAKACAQRASFVSDALEVATSLLTAITTALSINITVGTQTPQRPAANTSSRSYNENNSEHGPSNATARPASMADANSAAEPSTNTAEPSISTQDSTPGTQDVAAGINQPTGLPSGGPRTLSVMRSANGRPATPHGAAFQVPRARRSEDTARHTEVHPWRTDMSLCTH